MISLPKPTIDGVALYEKCVMGFRKGEFQDRLLACKDLINDAEKEFENRIGKCETHLIAKETCVNGNVTATDLKKVYTEKMVPEKSPGKDIYDQLKAVPKFGICPLCMQRKVEALDHYLPKADYPRLSVSPINLVPACTDCNKTLNSYSADKQEKASLHPYYDNLGTGTWLRMEVLRTNPVSFRFFVVPLGHWDEGLKQRVINHFNKLELNRLYSLEAASMVSKHQFLLKMAFDANGENEVSKKLYENYQTYSDDNPNSWESAFFLGTSIDDWFCQGGFQLI